MHEAYTVRRFNPCSIGIYHIPTKTWVKFGSPDKYPSFKVRAYQLNEEEKVQVHRTVHRRPVVP